MAKRGRPKVGKTVSIRVPEDIHLMITWIAAAQRRSSVRVAEDLWGVLSKDYFNNLETIKKLKDVEDKQAAEEGREPLSLPTGVLAVNPTYREEVAKGGKPKSMIPLHDFDFVKHQYLYLDNDKKNPLIGWRMHDSFDVEWNTKDNKIESAVQEYLQQDNTDRPTKD